MTIIYNKHKQLEKRRNLRKNSTKAEIILWNIIKNKQLGIKFRRQYGIGSYIVDFCSPRNKIIIEIDGEVHEEKYQKAYDEDREDLIKELGFKILRFKNEEVKTGLEKVIENIEKEIGEKI